MPPDPTPKTSASSRKRSTTSKRGAIACVRCKERKAKCVPAPPGTSNVPTCTNCHQARAVCVYLDRTPTELFLLEYVSQLENRVATLELELAKYQPDSIYVGDHSQTQAAAIKSLTQQYPPGDWALAGPSGINGNTAMVSGVEENTSPPAAVKEEQGQEEEEGNDDLAYGLGRLTLSGSGEPVYVGASSGVNWARVCATALRGPRANEEGGSSLSRFNYLAPPESSSIESALSYSQHHPIPPLPSPPLAARYLEAAYQHIQARYAFLDWPTIRNWHDNREAIVNRPLWGAGRGKDFRRSMAAFNLWLLYGYGARLTEDEHLEGAVSHEVYHNIAVACLSNVANHTSIATVQAELLLTIYSFRHPQPEISVWQTAGLAIRTAIQVGLHRKARSKAERERNPVAYEIKKRTFWSLYTIDRMLALQLGRPSSIQDRDIDVEMPLNIDVEYTDAQVIFDMQTKQIEATKGRVQGDEYAKGYDTITSMTSSIHNTRLNRLKQLIQDAIYRLDHPLETRTDRSTSNGIPEIDDLLSRLQAWKDASPTLPPGRSGVPLLSRLQQDMEYHNCVQMLLRPVISSRMGIDRYLSQCFDSAASLCEVQWTALNSPSTYRLSNWALYRLFLSGLTLLHLASSPSTAARVDLSRAQHAMQRCKDSLGVYVRHLPAMKGYEDVFVELISGWETKVMALPSGGQQPSSHVGTSPTGKNKVSPSQQSRIQSSPSTTGGELSNPLKWLESLSNTNQGQTQPTLHIPLQPAFPSQVGIHYGPQTTYTNAGGMVGDASYNQYSNNQPTLAQAANNMPTLSNYGVSMSQINQNRHPSVGPSASQTASHPNLSQSITDNNPYLNATTGNLLITSTSNGGNNTLGLGTSASSTSTGTHSLDLPSYSFPALEQLAAAPGASVRDDFFSLLSSLGVDMDETLGSSLPPIAEDHLWTSDWGLQATPAPAPSAQATTSAQNQNQNHTINPYLVSTQNSQTGQQQQQQQQQGQTTSHAQYTGEFGWMGDWQSPQPGSGMNVDDTDGSWTFPFM